MQDPRLGFSMHNKEFLFLVEGFIGIVEIKENKLIHVKGNQRYV